MIEVTTASYSDGETPLNGIVARDTSKTGKRPAVLLLHEAPGLSDHPKRRINMLAELGYVAFAADLFGDGKVLMGPPTMERLQKFMSTPGLLRKRVRAAYDAVLARDDVDPARLGVTGYCMGGTCVLELARSGARFAGGVTFHAGLEYKGAPATGTITPKLLVCTGADDPLAKAEDVLALQKELTAAKADWQIISYGGTSHAFTNKDVPVGAMSGFDYSASADRRSWLAMRNFFEEVFA